MTLKSQEKDAVGGKSFVLSAFVHDKKIYFFIHLRTV